MKRLSTPENRQHSIARPVVLHLLPEALITAFYIGVAPVVRDLGFPSLMADRKAKSWRAHGPRGTRLPVLV